MTRVNITKVLTRNFITDFISSFQNLIGMNLTYYERMIDKGIEKIEEEISTRNIKLKWHRYEISQLTNGALVIMLYGDTV